MNRSQNIRYLVDPELLDLLDVLPTIAVTVENDHSPADRTHEESQLFAHKQCLQAGNRRSPEDSRGVMEAETDLPG